MSSDQKHDSGIYIIYVYVRGVVEISKSSVYRDDATHIIPMNELYSVAPGNYCNNNNDNNDNNNNNSNNILYHTHTIYESKGFYTFQVGW